MARPYYGLQIRDRTGQPLYTSGARSLAVALRKLGDGLGACGGRAAGGTLQLTDLDTRDAFVDHAIPEEPHDG